jgi:hypothetical protein
VLEGFGRRAALARTRSGRKYDVHSLAGPVFDWSGAGPDVIGNDEHVPHFGFKVMRLTKPGQPLDRVSPSDRVIAILVPNDGSVEPRARVEEYRVTAAELQPIIGLKLFPGLPERARERLLTQFDTEPIRARRSPKAPLWTPPGAGHHPPVPHGVQPPAASLPAAPIHAPLHHPPSRPPVHPGST